MMYFKLLIMLLLTLFIWTCGKVGPLSLPDDKLDMSVINYPCDEECQKKFEEEKKRQQSIVLQTD